MFRHHVPSCLSQWGGFHSAPRWLLWRWWPPYGTCCWNPERNLQICLVLELSSTKKSRPLGIIIPFRCLYIKHVWNHDFLRFQFRATLIALVFESGLAVWNHQPVFERDPMTTPSDVVAGAGHVVLAHLLHFHQASIKIGRSAVQLLAVCPGSLQSHIRNALGRRVLLPQKYSCRYRPDLCMYISVYII